MRSSTKNVLKAGGIIVAVVLAMFVGYITSGAQSGTTIGGGLRATAPSVGSVSTQDLSANKSTSADQGAVGTEGYSGVAPESASAPDVSGATPASPSPDRLVISTAAMSLRVDDIEEATADVRAISAKYGAIISDLTLDAGGQPVPEPMPLDSRSGAVGTPYPSSANITLRVPAAKLSKMESEAAKLGRLLSQSASENDVSQQHVDMAARLKNLQAEESRLREFLNKATKVSEMLDVERELSRVRGEIESMQAQLTYLDRQVALATLTINLSETGPVVRPASGGWGFLEAVTNGVQAAAALLRLFISGTIALLPLLLAILLGWLGWRAAARRRGRKRSEAPSEGDEASTTAGTDTNDDTLA